MAKKRGCHQNSEIQNWDKPGRMRCHRHDRLVTILKKGKVNCCGDEECPLSPSFKVKEG